MPSLFEVAPRRQILNRVKRLSPHQRPVWGRFTAPEMVCHVSSGLRQGLGELDAAPARGPLASYPLNWLAIHLLPWPKGRVKSPPELLVARPTTWEADLVQLCELIERFGAQDPNAHWPESAVFGRISGRSWGVLQYRHLDHHLHQFQV